MSFQIEEYRRYTIRSGPLKGQWGANAFRGKLLVAKATADSRDEAIARLKTNLSELDAVVRASCDSEGAPSADVYKRAFQTALPKMPASYVAMLKAHLIAPDYLISATKLAEAAGYVGYEGANLHYGKLGFLVAEEIGFEPPKREDGSPIWTCAIARDPQMDTEFPQTSMLDALIRGIESGHFEWQMRPQVVQALKSLGV